METKSCEYCGATITANESNKNHFTQMRFCNPQHREAARNERRRVAVLSQAERVEAWHRNQAEFVDDVRLLMSSDSPPNIAKRMGMPLGSIRSKLRRMGRGDLADQLLSQEERYAIVKPGCFGPPTY